MSDREEQVSTGDVETMSKNGQWVNRVIGDREDSRSFSSREEAEDAGRRWAEELGTTHIIRGSEPTGVITDPAPTGGSETTQEQLTADNPAEEKTLDA
ncbi:MAG TPA: DUF2188 domain-containing protein, partial [Microbacterium sp.]|nr:DUF2188 domain-containing protein [Microbacterium sp.]